MIVHLLLAVMYIKESLDATAEYVTQGMSTSQHKQ